jgi:hypothetical protein
VPHLVPSRPQTGAELVHHPRGAVAEVASDPESAGRVLAVGVGSRGDVRGARDPGPDRPLCSPGMAGGGAGVGAALSAGWRGPRLPSGGASARRTRDSRSRPSPLIIVGDGPLLSYRLRRSGRSSRRSHVPPVCGDRRLPPSGRTPDLRRGSGVAGSDFRRSDGTKGGAVAYPADPGRRAPTLKDRLWTGVLRRSSRREHTSCTRAMHPASDAESAHCLSGFQRTLHP